MDAHKLWQDSHQRILALLRDRQDAGSVTTTIPGWDVRDLVAHIVGAEKDLLEGTNDPGHGTQWAARHLQERPYQDLPSIIEEWEELTPRIERLFAHGDEKTIDALIVEVTTHEQDLRTALAESPLADPEALAYVAEVYTTVLGERFDRDGLGSLTFVTDTWEGTAGMGVHQGDVHVDLFELQRGLSGRRSREQMRSWDWSTNPEPYLDRLSVPGRPRETPLVEHAQHSWETDR